MSNTWWSPIALIVFGLLTARGADQVAERSTSPARDRWLFAAAVAGWLGAWLGGWWLLLAVANRETAAALWLAALTVAGRIRERRRAAQRNALAWVLVAAAELQSDAAQAIMALAAEQRGRIAVRLRALASRIRAGAAWGAALQADRTLLSEAELAATYIGAANGSPFALLRDIAEWEAARDAVCQSLRSKVLNLAAANAVVLVISTSLAAYVGRGLHRLVGETDVRLPASLAWLVDAGRAIAAWHVAYPGFARALPLLAFIPCLMLAWRWRLFDGLAGRNPAWFRLPAGVVLRLFAAAAEPAGLSPTASVHALAGSLTRGGWGRRWQRVAAQCQSGRPWWRSLADERLVPVGDAEALHSAERRGTLPRALRERANAADRQAVRRLRVWVAVLLTVCLWGLVIGGALAQLAFWLPLLKLSLPV